VITEGDVYRVEIPYIPTLSEGDTESTLKSGLKTEDKILEIIKQDDKISYDDMADILAKSRRGIAKQIKKLQEEGRLRRVGPERSSLGGDRIMIIRIVLGFVAFELIAMLIVLIGLQRFADIE
jgi:ATP-dependent DNA helicase RecG